MALPARLSRNMLTLLTSNVGSAALSFILSVLIGRVLGQDGLGVYAAVLAWVFPLSLMAEFGLGTLMTRDLAQSPDATEDYLHATTQARLWLGGGLTLALFLIAPVLSSDPAVVSGLRISAPIIVILPAFGAFTAIFRARQAMWPIPWLNLGMLVTQVILTALVFLQGGGITAALVVNTVTSLGQLFAAWLVWRWKFRDSERTQHSVSLHVISLLKRAWPFALAGVLAAVQTRVGTILLEMLTDTAQVGYYAAATRFVEAARMIPNALFGALFPALAALASQPTTMKWTFQRVMLGLGGFGFALGLMFTVLAQPILQLTYGAAFIPAATTLQVAMWSLLPGFLRAGRMLYWYAQGREQVTNIVIGVILVTQFALSVWLIPRAGAVGTAVVMLATEILALILLYWPLKHHHEQPDKA
jgi:O-antigen/teichoic acid export membrane protein